MSSTRADLLNPLLIPLLAGTMFDFLLARVYLARPNIKFVFAICLLMHIHYGFGVVCIIQSNTSQKDIKLLSETKSFLIVQFQSAILYLFEMC